MKRVRNTLRILSRRRGSVLILVVALLVLLALLGTAYISTSRIDRSDAAQNAANTQSDLLLQGVVNLAMGAITGDLFDTATPPNYRVGTGYFHFDSVNDDNSDLWLGDRVPQWVVTGLGTGYPIWPAIGWPLVQPLTGPQFDRVNSAVAFALSNPRSQYHFEPITLPDASGVNRPAIQLRDAATGNAIVNGSFIAADADGDGIADSGLWKLPISPIAGVTYYAAVRIIDNNSAVNVNTAWSWQNEFSFGGTSYASIYNSFPANIGLQEMLVNSAEMAGLNRWRFNGVSLLTSTALVDDSAAARTDALFVNQGEAMWSQMARRLDNPGYRDTTARFQPYPPGEGAGLAYRFTLRNPSASQLTIETTTDGIPSSVYNTPGGLYVLPRSQSYPPGQAAAWFRDNFDFGNLVSVTPPLKPLRSVLVTRNQVANVAPRINMAVLPAAMKETPTAGGALADPNKMPDYSAVNWPAPRVSINTAPFGELWRGFWSVMADPANLLQAEGAATMFRSSVRNPAPAIPLAPFDMLQLRSALASINAMDLRDVDADISSRKLTLLDAAGVATAEVTVYGTERQLYMTEAILDIDVAGNKYLAIELHNPHDPGAFWSADQMVVNLKNCKLAALDRATMTLTPVHDFAASTATLVGGEYKVLASAAAPPAAVPPLPGIVVTGAPVVDTLDPNLILGKELVLLRPRLANGTLVDNSAAADPAQRYNETLTNANYLYDLIPVDQLDFTGIVAPAVGTAARYRYCRPNLKTTDAWKCVYPGIYDPSAAIRQTGWKTVVMATPDTTDGGNLGLGDATVVAPAPQQITYLKNFATQINPYDCAFRDKPTFTPPYNFPYGGFARLGDVLQVPFIGAYRVNAPGAPTTLRELNSITMDAAMAEDGDATNDANEALGRFCPGSLATLATYAWAADIFDHFSTSQNPNDDYLPAVTDPATYAARTSQPAPLAVANGAKTTNLNLFREDVAPIDGLININTASWKVLSMLPMHTDPAINEALARAIVFNRTANGPFRSIWELNRIPTYTVAQIGGTVDAPAFRAALGDPATTDFDDNAGDLSPFGLTMKDGVLNDYEQQYAMIIRLSNLITVRSDSFTVYVLLQGWQDAGTANARLVTERRAAFIADRSGVTATNRTLRTVPVATD